MTTNLLFTQIRNCGYRWTRVKHRSNPACVVVQDGLYQMKHI